MQFLIDTANTKEIDEAIELGFVGITANPVMYNKQKTTVKAFISENKDKTPFITAEVIGTYEQMIEQVETIIAEHSRTIIKLNYGVEELKLTKYLKENKIKFAFTLIFTPLQAMLAIQAGASYLFYFIARNEELGNNPEQLLSEIRKIINENDYDCELIGASIRNHHHLNCALKYCEYAAIPLALIKSSFENEQVKIGAEQFKANFVIS